MKTGWTGGFGVGASAPAPQPSPKRGRFYYPQNPAGHKEALKKAERCWHAARLMDIVWEKPDPSPRDEERTKAKLFCRKCGAIKYYYRNGRGELRRIP